MKAICLTILLSIVCFSAIAQKQKPSGVWGIEFTYAPYKEPYDRHYGMFDTITLKTTSVSVYRTLLDIKLAKRDKWYSPSKVKGHLTWDVGLGYSSFQAIYIYSYPTPDIETYKSIRFITKLGCEYRLGRIPIKLSTHFANGNIFNPRAWANKGSIFYGARLQTGVTLLNGQFVILPGIYYEKGNYPQETFGGMLEFRFGRGWVL